MYRYQQRQWLQRQQMNEEEERERLKNLRQIPDIALSHDERQNLEVKYQQTQPARLLNPTNYHLQQATTRPSGVIPPPANSLQMPQRMISPPMPSTLIKHEEDSLGALLSSDGMDPFVSSLDGQSILGADGMLTASDNITMHSDMATSPAPSSIDMQFSPPPADPLVFLDLDQTAGDTFLASANGSNEMLPSSSAPIPISVAIQQQQQQQMYQQQQQQLLRQQQMMHANSGRPQSGSGAVQIPSDVSPGVVPAGWAGAAPITSGSVPNFVPPAGNYQFHFSSSVPPQFPSPDKSSPNSSPDAWTMEKRRRRRESHNAVERRRRDNINDRITELSLLVPDCVDDVNPTAKPNKGIILRKSADYIRYLQEANRRLQKQVVTTNGGQLPDALSSELDGLSHKFLDNDEDSIDLGDSDGD